MRPSLLMGIIGSVIVAGLQLTSMLGDFTGTWGGMLFYGPMLFYFACIYLSIRKTKDIQPDHVLPFKTGLKEGGITALFICVSWGIAFYIGLTHQDVRGFVNYKIANNQQAEIPAYLQAFSSPQHMFDMTKFWAMPNFLLGFLIIILSTVLIARRKKS
ncbi:MAG TPA: hypothetical protein VK826_00860 [Bacteroidia bacterium]|nr:hypothetical protein [Bacteroidia bacterium]